VVAHEVVLLAGFTMLQTATLPVLYDLNTRLVPTTP